MRIWTCSWYTMGATVLGFTLVLLMARSFLTQQLDNKGCDMSYMRPSFFKFDTFDTEHTRFASKYSLYLYREGGIDEDFRVWSNGIAEELWLMFCAGQGRTCSFHSWECWQL